MSENKIVIFDLDGTLLDTLADLSDGVNRMLSHFGYPNRTHDEVKEMVGNGARLLALRAIPDGENNPRAEECVAYLLANYHDESSIKAKPYLGIPELLDTLKAHGIFTAVVTNKPDRVAKDLCNRFFGGRLDIVMGDREGRRRKPYPDSVFECIERFDCKRAIFVGDADTDIEVAKNAQIPSVSMSWGFRNRDFLASHGAEKIADDVNELACALSLLLEEDLGNIIISEKT